MTIRALERLDRLRVAARSVVDRRTKLPDEDGTLVAMVREPAYG